MAQAVYEAHDWYRSPLYYDIVFDQDTEVEADFLTAMAGTYGTGRNRCALEPACGSGRLVHALGRRGYKSWGFDLSAPMLDFARQRLTPAAGARLWRADLESFRAPPAHFGLSHCLVSTFKYLLDEEAARSHLARVAATLAPGGIYVLGLHLSDYDDRAGSVETWRGRRGGVAVSCRIESDAASPRRRREAVRSRLTVRRAGAPLRRLETAWWFRTYSAAQLRRLLATVPDLEHVATYDFTYNIRRPRELDDGQLDCVLILRRRRGTQRRPAVAKRGAARHPAAL